MAQRGRPRPQEFQGLISLLRFFAETGRFNVLDRMGLAQSPVAVREAVYEAIRTVRALERRQTRLTLRVKIRRDGEETRELTFDCLEYEEVESTGECLGVQGELVRAEGAPGLSEGALVCCHPKPRVPGEEELERFFEALDSPWGLDLAKEVAALAFSFHSKKRGGEA